MPNVMYALIDKWVGVDIETEMGTDGCVTEVDNLMFNDNRGFEVVASAGSLLYFDGMIFAVIAIYTHPESGCAWFYAREGVSSQYVRIDVECYASYNSNGWTSMGELTEDDLPF